MNINRRTKSSISSNNSRSGNCDCIRCTISCSLCIQVYENRHTYML